MVPLVASRDVLMEFMQVGEVVVRMHVCVSRCMYVYVSVYVSVYVRIALLVLKIYLSSAWPYVWMCLCVRAYI